MIFWLFEFFVRGVLCRPDEINGQLAGYNYVFGLQLSNPFELLNGGHFGDCYRDRFKLENKINLKFGIQSRINPSQLESNSNL